MALPNIPVLSALPDIFSAYSTNPALSFIIDLMLLCGLFAALLAPLGARVLGRDTTEGKTKGNKFGALLGIVIGASAAFSLRAAGIPLLSYWLTAVVAAVLIGTVLYKFLTKLHVKPLPAIAIAILVSLIIMDPLLLGSKNQIVRNIFGFLSLLWIPAFFLFVIWAVSRMHKARAEQIGTQPSGEPRPPGFLKRMFGEHGLLGMPRKIWEKIKYGKHPSEPKPPTLTPEQVLEKESIARLAHEEERAGIGPAAALPRKDIENAEKIIAPVAGVAADVQKGAEELTEAAEFTIDEANQVQRAVEQGNIEQLCTALEQMIARIKAEIQKPMQKHQAQLAILVNLGNKINKEVMQPYNTHIRSLQAADAQALQQIEQGINRLPAGPAREELVRSLERLRADVQAVQTLQEIVKRLNEHLRFLQSTQLIQLYDDTKELGKYLLGYVQGLEKKNCRQLSPQEATALVEEVKARLPLLMDNLTRIRTNCQQIIDASKQSQIVINTIRAEIKHWKETYNSIITRLLQGFAQRMEELQKKTAELAMPVQRLSKPRKRKGI